MDQPNSKKIPRWLLWGLGAAFALLCLLCLPLLGRMARPEFGAWLQDWVAGLGIWGVLAMLGVQLLQIVVAIIPGEPVELAAGTMYGALGGLVLCLTGCVLGSAAIFWGVRRRGRAAFAHTALGEKLSRYDFLQNEQKLEAMVFLLYFIPGTPKDILVYVCALSHISMGRFLLLSTLARVPSVITSTWAGASFASGNLWLTVGIFAATGLLGLGGIIINNRLLSAKNRREPPSPPQPEKEI